MSGSKEGKSPVLEALRKFLLQKNGIKEFFSFGQTELVYKVRGKMFALIAWKDDPLRITLKFDPVKARLLRHRYPAIEPGCYMSKDQWNTIRLDGNIPAREILTLIDESYRFALNSLSSSERMALEAEARQG